MSVLARLQAVRDAATQGPWEPYFTIHGDPKVTQQGRGLFGVVADVATAPDDYGRTDAIYIATFDPTLVASMLAVMDAVDGMLRNPGIAPFSKETRAAWEHARQTLRDRHDAFLALADESTPTRTEDAAPAMSAWSLTPETIASLSTSTLGSIEPGPQSTPTAEGT